MKLKFYTICLVLLFFCMQKVCRSQSYGLGFASHEVEQDKRTSLDLSEGQVLCFDSNFELAFDLSFIPGYNDYFGYIFRLIDQDNRNIDLIYDKRFTEKKHFKLIIDNKLSNITFDISIDKLYKKWHNLKLKFDKRDQKLIFTVGDTSYSQNLSLTKNCYKILFGANNYKKFHVRDVPPMKVRNIQILNGQEVIYSWPLNGRDGLYAKEEIKGKNGTATNPIWVRRLHHDWKIVQTINMKGAASMAMNPDSNELYIISEDSLAIYNLGLHKLCYIPYHSGKSKLLRGNQSLYDTVQNQLHNVYIDQKLLTTFNFSDSSWNKKYTSPDTITNYWHYNKFYSERDSALYMIGGYGQYTYKNEVQRYHFPTDTWQHVSVKGNFTPRYLAALGKVSDGVYIFGGYGSSTGEQILNPKNFYDMTFFDIKQKTFKTVFKIQPNTEEFAFANSMVIDEETRTYYTLIFPNYKYNSSLQLIKGSLDSASYSFVGGEIPYAFHDIYSFADLFYSAELGKFIAVSSFYDDKNNNTLINIYTLSSPPEPYLVTSFEKPLTKFWLYLMIILLLLVACYLYIRKVRLGREKIKLEPLPVSENEEETTIRSEQLVTQTRLKETVENTAFLFGHMQLFDEEGEDITKYFTPLIKELFLIILLYTIRWERGISSEKLTEILWFDKSSASARNNRSVNIAKLKTILGRIDSVQVSKDTGYWKINFEEEKVYIDYNQYMKIVGGQEPLNKQRIIELSKIIQRGGFLSDVEYDWLDTFKSEISNDIINTYLTFASSLKISEDPEFVIDLMNYIFYFDFVNEEAMIIKCKALVYLGKHSLAKTTFENFNKEYKAIYGEEFGKNFQEIL